MLGRRHPEIYGRETLADIEQACRERAAELELGIEFRQSDYEGQIVDWIEEARQHANGNVISAGLGYPYALDALARWSADAIA